MPSDSNEHGYLTWHRDKPAADGWPVPNYRLVKVFVAIFDIVRACAPHASHACVPSARFPFVSMTPYARVPGSHRGAAPPAWSLERTAWPPTRVKHFEPRSAAARPSANSLIAPCPTWSSAPSPQELPSRSIRRRGTRAFPTPVGHLGAPPWLGTAQAPAAACRVGPGASGQSMASLGHVA